MRKIYTVLAIIVVLIIVGIFWWQRGLLAANSSDKTPKIFIVKVGDGVREIANNLKSQGFIKDPIVFFLLTKVTNLDKRIQAGDFRLNPAMNLNEIASSLTHGILDIWVTIPEGKRAEEVADLLKINIPSYEESWRAELIKNEGYLFPDTYLIPKDASVEMVINLMRNNFDLKYTSVKNTKTTSLSDSDTIKVASIIEREAAFAVDRPLVSSVIMNRLELGMPLEVDPAIQYAVGYDKATKQWWKKVITFDDLRIDSPYNLRLNMGLPPTPISNPGLSSIQAALKPATSDFLYFYSDLAGHIHFAKDLAGHNANIKKYKP